MSSQHKKRQKKGPSVEAPKRGRPTAYTPELAADICTRLATGESLRSICRGNDMPPESTVRRWARGDLHGFLAQYVRARDLGLDALADEVMEIADTPQYGVIETIDEDGMTIRTEDMVAHRRLQFDARRWYLSKLAPKRYGDRIEHTGPEAGPVQVSINIR